MSRDNLQSLERKLGVKFTDQDILLNALVHRSYLNEHPSFNLDSNERLEFLGDACLELAVSEFLFTQYPRHPEGDLTNFRSALVNTISLAETARELRLGDYLLLSKGEEEGGGRDSEHLLANAFEALIGAVYLEKGIEAVRILVTRLVTPKIEDIVKTDAFKDAKSSFQEIVQEEGRPTPVYEVLSETGPDHDKTFVVGVLVSDKQSGQGQGSSKQKAELAAAQDALEKWKESGRI